MSDPRLSFLADNDTPCPICRYNLRGLLTPRCPECAAPLHLAVASPNLHLGPFVLTIVSFSLAAGFDLVVATMVGIMTSIHATMAASATWIGPAILASVLGTAGLTCIGLVILLVKKRHRWNRLPLRHQWAAAVATFLIVGLSHAGLGAFLLTILN